MGKKENTRFVFFVRTVGINVNLASTENLNNILRHCFQYSASGCSQE